MNKYSPINNLFKTTISSIIVLIISIYISPYISNNNFILFTILASLVAFTISLFLNINGSFLVLSPLIVFSFFWQEYLGNFIPSWIYICIFTILALIHLPAWWTQVPYFPTPKITDNAIARIINNNHSNNSLCNFIDIGCGNGRLLSVIAKDFPNINFYGVELSILPFLVAKFRSLFIKNLKIRFQSFWDINFNDFDFIYAFLSPAPMDELEKKYRSTGKKNSFFISNSFPFNFDNDSKENDLVLIEEINLDIKTKGALIFLYKLKKD